MSGKSSLTELLTRARRRCIAHLLADQSALAVTIGMGGAILLLLAGTQILDWYWVVLLTVVSLGTGLYRLRKTIPSTYTLAQRMDRRLSLADALSTAIYFSSSEFSSSKVRGEEAIRERQRGEAEAIARTVDVRAGVPYHRSRYIIPALGLLLVACGLFAVRYAVTGSLNLRPSLVRMAFDTFFSSKTELAKANKGKKPGDMKPPPLDPGSPEGPTTQNDMAPDSVLDTVDIPDVNNPQATDQSKSAARDGSQPETPPEAQGENSDKGDKSAAGNEADDDKGPQGDQSKNGKQNAKQESKQGSASENSSLMDKLRDAMANMLNKMKSQKDGQPSPQTAQGKQGGQQDKSNQQKSQQAKSQSADAEATNDQSQSDGDKKQSAEARGNEKSSDKNASQDSKSGIGLY